MKTDRYKINTNPKKLSSEQIARHQDFDALLEIAGTAPPAKNPYIRWIGLVSAAAAAALVGVYLIFGWPAASADGLNAEDYFAALPYVHPPLEQAEPDFSTFIMDANEGGVYEHESGSRLVVPKAAFTNDRGQLISGEVEIKYREFQDFVDFFLAGIPMVYDSAETNYQLESAGMLELYAEQNGEKLRLHPEKSIDIALVSEIRMEENQAIPEFNIYYLDTTQRNWVYQGVDRIELAESMEEARFDDTGADREQAYQEELEALANKKVRKLAAIEATIALPARPLQPAKADEEAITFEMDFGKIPLPNAPRIDNNLEDAQMAVEESKREMEQLRNQWEGTIWQVKAGQEQLLDESFSQTIWDEEKSQLKAINERDYELHLQSANKSLRLLVNPVLSKTDYDAAVAKFSERFAAYEAEMKDREQQLAADKAALNQRIADEKALLDKRYEERIAQYERQGLEDRATDLRLRQKIVNRFQATRFGIWNCDRPLPPYIYILRSDFVDDQQKEITGQPAYLVNKTQNTLVRFFTTSNTRVQFNHQVDNLMWTITKDNQLAVFDSERFRQIDLHTGKYTFEMQRKEVDLSDEKAIRAALQFD